MLSDFNKNQSMLAGRQFNAILWLKMLTLGEGWSLDDHIVMGTSEFPANGPPSMLWLSCLGGGKF